MTDINSIIVEINTITKDIKDAFGPFLSVGRNVLGFGAIIWIMIDGIKVMSSGERDGLANHLHGWLKPLFISLLLLFYNPILSLCDFLISPTYAATEGWAVSYMQQNEQIEAKYKQDLESLYLSNTNQVKEDNSFLGIDTLIADFKAFMQKVELYTSEGYILGSLLMIISKIANMCLLVSYLGILTMQNANLAIIIAFGPISIGLSVFHPFGDNWKAFYANYVSKLLWYPVANMCLAIAYRLKNISDQNTYDALLAYTKAILTANAANPDATMTDHIAISIHAVQHMDWMPIFLGIGVTIVGFFLVINTPSLVGNIITGVSGGMNSSPVSGTMAAGAIGAATYKGFSAAGGAISGLSNKVNESLGALKDGLGSGNGTNKESPQSPKYGSPTSPPNPSPVQV
jgi:hypothetical protein